MAISKEKKGEDSKSNNYLTLMAEFGHEAKKIRKVNQSVTFFAKQAEIQSRNVDKIADNSANILTAGLTKAPGKNKRTIDGLVAGISSVSLQEQIKSILRPPGGVSKNNNDLRGKTEFLNYPSVKLSNAITLPVTSSSLTDEEETEFMSESDSEFIPDWSSMGSCATNISNSPSNFADDELEYNSPFDNHHASDVWLLSDDDLEEDTFNEVSHMSHNLVPPLACGNGSDNEPCSSNAPSPPSTTASGQVDNKFSSHAIRRVKSMAQDISIDKEIGNAERVRLLKIKSKNDPTFTNPSPLLSREDFSSVKKSQSFTNAKFSLKRSRSNIGVFTQYSRGTYERDVIHEEEESF